MVDDKLPVSTMSVLGSDTADMDVIVVRTSKAELGSETDEDSSVGGGDVVAISRVL